MPVHVNELITDVTAEDDRVDQGDVSEGSERREPPSGDELRRAHDLMVRDRLRVRSEGLSD